MNIFGEGALGAASIAWVTGLSDGYRTRQDLDFRQDVWSIDAQYEPFSPWAGPVSIAAGFEYRKESFSSTAAELSLASPVGRASWRERVCADGLISVGGVA